ncbi:MAG: glycosyltransferase family 39 protein [Clostridiaceae bacterium]|nr:glycosyltransferase family 39 protein [Clostridiaceae bacterium]
MVKKIMALILFIFVCTGIIAGKVFAEENIIVNGGFEEVSGKAPQGWDFQIWNQQGDSKVYLQDQDVHLGHNAVTIENSKMDDAKLVQKIKVSANTIYSISCWIKAQVIDENAKGANIGVVNIFDTSKDLKDTKDKWQFIELYGRTGKDQKELQVDVRLGGYGSLNAGKATFDDFSLEKVDKVPLGTEVINFSEAPLNSIAAPVVEVSSTTNHYGDLYFGLFVMCLLFFAFFWGKNLKIKTIISNKNEKIALFTIIFLGLLIRIIIGLLTEGFVGDINCFKGWASEVSSIGMANFYLLDGLRDYPPGYMYILYIIGKIQMTFSLDWNSSIMLLIMKLPAIIADIISSYIIFRISKKRVGSYLALGLCLIYALNPAVIYNSGVWGQIDGLFTMLILLMLMFAEKERLIGASIIYIIALLVKPQTLIFTPILLFAFIKKKDIKIIAYSAIAGILLFVILILPFSLKQNAFWIIDKYTKTLNSYPYGSLNAFNFFAFVGGNWDMDTTKLMLLSYKTWSFLFIVLTVFFGGFVFFKSKIQGKLPYVAFFTIISVFMFTTKMHERYMFPALALCLVWYIFSKDKRALIIFAVFSATHFINVAYVLDRSSQQGGLYIPSTNVLLELLSFVNLLFYFWVVGIGIEYCKKVTKKVTIKVLHKNAIRETELAQRILKPQEKNQSKYKQIDFVLIGVLIIIYSIVAFINLGSTKVPKSFWKPSVSGESYLVDLGEGKDISKISYYLGLGEGRYIVNFSEDGKIWGKDLAIDQPSIYNWNISNLKEHARYVKFSVINPGAMINEIGIFGANSKSPYAIKEITGLQLSPSDEGRIENIFDEQKYVKTSASYLTGTYFDEIYHARTAYEQLHKIEPFEWTHPPLGKIIISLGVWIFGMNPFGWRIMGTFFGICMIPLMYMLGKRIFKKTEYGFIAAFLISFDFMHFTQTRIATVDVFAVFFIILMYYFMFIFSEVRLFNQSIRKSLIPLALCGTSFALGMATKWIALYAAVGLAIIFFLKMYSIYEEYRHAVRFLAVKGSAKDKTMFEACKKIKEQYFSYTVKLLCGCVVFFIILPLIIYVISYIPFMRVPGAGHGFKEVLSLQREMYSYHSKLVATHPFESSSLQWPFMLKPMWYYSGVYLPAGKMSSIVAIGNPAIWWVGVFAVIGTAIIGIKKKDKIALFIIIGGLSQYLPWILVKRLTFIYHYFATVPFVMLCIVYMVAYYQEKNKKAKYYVYGYMVLVVLMFILFYPVISGLIVDKSYVKHYLTWFKNWYFFS